MTTTPDQTAALERLAEEAAAPAARRARRRLHVVVNPRATTIVRNPPLRNLVVAALQGRYDVDVSDTAAPRHAAELAAAAAADGADAVVALGGDGTINEAANGLAGTDCALACLPGGATNVYCRMTGVPMDVVDATQHLLGLADDWRVRAVDLGRVNDRWFTFSAGAGLDASVVERVDARPDLKARFGPWFFAESAVATFLARYVRRPPGVIAAAGGREIRGVSVFVQNAQPYTYFKARPVRLAGGAALDSGDLSAAVLTRASPLDLPTITFRLLAATATVGGHRRVEVLDGLQALTVRSTDDRPVPVQVDGDFIGAEEQAVFTVGRGAMRLLA
jgi:diacylglycerol kinase family enzyme